MKECFKCKQIKVLTDFCKDVSKKDKLKIYCKDCSNKMRRDWSKANPGKSNLSGRAWYWANLEKKKEAHLRRKFNINMQQYKAMLESQEGRCAICKTHQSELKKKLAVDHNHKSREIRGLLCQECNHALGLFKDSEKVIEAALSYLKK